MSTMTTGDGVPVPPITWRDAVTPYGRASRRRWTACYALLLMQLAAVVVDQRVVPSGGRGDASIPLLLIVAPAVVFGMLRRATRRLTASDHPELDERDVAARNDAYRVAFPLLVVAVLVGLVLLGASLDGTTRWTEIGPRDRTGESGWFLQSGALLALVVWIALWAAFLPTGALAWREPDAPELQPGTPWLSETLRDTLLGLTLAGGIGLALVTGSQLGVVWFVAALALLGALARHAVGQPIISRAGLVAIALVLAAVALAVFGLGASSGGGGGGPAIEVPERQR